MTREMSLREQLVETMRDMADHGLNRGTAGNASVRTNEGMLITPSGVVPTALSPDQMVLVRPDGTWDSGGHAPSSEWRMHKGILDQRSDIAAVVHCHSHHATVLACLDMAIPPIHYMIRISGDFHVPVAPYAAFGTDALAQSVVRTLDGRRACLMASHGQIAVGPTLGTALAIAEQIEEQAAIYCGTLAIGKPRLLTEQQMQDVMQSFRTYGQRR